MSLNDDVRNNQVLANESAHANDQTLPVEVAHAHDKDSDLEQEAPADASALSDAAVNSVAGPVGAVVGTVGPFVGPTGAFAGMVAGGMLQAAAEDKPVPESDDIYTRVT